MNDATNAIWDFDGTTLLAYSNDLIPYALGKELGAKRMDRLANMMRMLEGVSPMPLLGAISGETRYDFMRSDFN